MSRFWVHFDSEPYEYLVEAISEGAALAVVTVDDTNKIVIAVPIHKLIKNATYCYRADPPKSNRLLFSEVSPPG